MGRHRRAEERFRLLYVCTGNICRSPLAELTTRHLVHGRLAADAAAFSTSSAGLAARPGAPMHPDSRMQLARLGVANELADDFAARQLTIEMVERSHLVLGAGPRHRSSVVSEVPAALPITFTVREFARLAEAVDPARLPESPVERAHALVELARRHRGSTPPEAGGDGIADPMGGPPAAHEVAADQVSAAVRRIVDVLAPGA